MSEDPIAFTDKDGKSVPVYHKVYSREPDFALSHDDRFIHMEERHRMSGGISLGTMDTKDAAIRAALIAMGWTPSPSDRFLTATVSQDGGTIGLDHPSEAPWADVRKAMTILRDHLEDRIERQDQCPVKPKL